MIHIDRLLSALQLDEFDAAAFELMESQLAWVMMRTGRYFGEVKQFTQRFVGGEQVIWLPEEPVVAVETPLAVAQGYGETWTDVDSADYEVDGRMIVHLSSIWTSPSMGTPRRNVRVTYYAGYEIGGLPGDIEQLILDLTARNWLDRGKENLKSEKIGDSYAYTLADRGSNGSGGLTRQQEDTISLWRTPVFA